MIKEREGHLVLMVKEQKCSVPVAIRLAFVSRFFVTRRNYVEICSVFPLPVASGHVGNVFGPKWRRDKKVTNADGTVSVVSIHEISKDGISYACSSNGMIFNDFKNPTPDENARVETMQTELAAEGIKADLDKPNHITGYLDLDGRALSSAEFAGRLNGNPKILNAISKAAVKDCKPALWKEYYVEFFGEPNTQSNGGVITF